MTDEEAANPKLFPATINYEKIEVLKNVPYLCFAPASVWFTKQFPLEKWIELTQVIPETLILYIIGSSEDYSQAEKIRISSSNKNIRNLCGELDILDTAALMQSAVINIVNDSAPMHIASAMNAPVCAIFCSTIPSFGFGPLSDRSYIVETEQDLTCRPCGLHGGKSCPERHFNCAWGISTQKILDIVHKELQYKNESR
jgi:heptosyltransferase-2